MNIFIAADDKYIYPAKVMLTSFFINNAMGSHKIYFMYSAIKEESLHELQELVRMNQAEFIPLKISASDFGRFGVSARFPVEVYYRFLAAHFLPKEEDRALWLDVDLIVNHALDGLYSVDFRGKAFAACESIGNHSEISKNLGCSPDAVYINSGVLLLNAKEMRRYTIEDYLAYYEKHQDAIVWPDQDILNGMFENDMLILDNKKYNVQILNGRFPDREEVRSIEEQSAIVHFIGYYKPWHSEYTNPCAMLWDKYHAILHGKEINYLYVQRFIRWMRRRIRIPFKEFRGKLYENSNCLRRMREIIRKQ